MQCSAYQQWQAFTKNIKIHEKCKKIYKINYQQTFSRILKPTYQPYRAFLTRERILKTIKQFLFGPIGR